MQYKRITIVTGHTLLQDKVGYSDSLTYRYTVVLHSNQAKVDIPFRVWAKDYPTAKEAAKKDLQLWESARARSNGGKGTIREKKPMSADAVAKAEKMLEMMNNLGIDLSQLEAMLAK